MPERTHLRRIAASRFALAGVLALAGCGPDAVSIARKAASYLWDAQDADGGWHSDVHGLARSGQSWTAFTLFHLLRLPDDLYELPTLKARQALAFIEARTDTSSGAAAALGFADSAVPDYPVYATAFALRAYLLARERGLITARQERLIPRMAVYLIDQQNTEAQGIGPDDPAYGGWGMGGRPADPSPTAVRTAPAYADVSHTRRAVEALAAAAREFPHLRARTHVAFSAALAFFARVQKRGLPAYDGGFYYSPVILSLNKGGLVNSTGTNGAAVPRSYATATCDGLLGMLATGRTVTTEPVQAAAAYLAAHDTLRYAAGLPDSRAVWRKVLFFYHLAGRAEVHARLAPSGTWREDVVSLLRRRQRDDGSFLNTFGAPNRENDPIIATTLALSALRNSL